ncbi:SLC13 family permease [Rhodovulum sp. YNF3179]|uniref:SLC13 family permease n=1 Tax=Rhodovulum sp. YNF3179 TaxID=3425127 RepID=UPI003D327AEF
MRLSILLGLAGLAVPLILPPPGAMPEPAWRAAGLALMMAVWWLTEALPLAATALVPLALAPPLGLGGIGAVAPSYSNPLIILFLGGFLLAKAIERWGLHRRLALWLLGFAGSDPRRILAAVMGATAFLSLWISNTASSMVMMPIAAAVATAAAGARGFATAVMLGVAFAATIGGMGSLIGTPPNAIFAAFVAERHGIEIGFARWALVGLPVALLLLAIAWALLAWVSPGTGSGAAGALSLERPGPAGRGERRVAAIAGLTALAWIGRPLLDWVFPGLALSDAGIAMTAALALFLLPSGEGTPLLDWKTAATLRWDVLILFGGGLALAGVLERSGLAAWIGAQVTQMGGLPVPLLILAIAAVIVYVGELASNTAMASIFLPIASAVALGIGADPVAFMLPVALAASVGFMLPVATPPNAIVFAHPSVTRAAMLQAGAPLDVIGIVVAAGLAMLIAPLAF